MEEFILDILVSEEKNGWIIQRHPSPLAGRGGDEVYSRRMWCFLDSILKCRKHWREIHTESDSGYKCTLSFYNHAKKPGNETYESHTPLQAKCTFVKKNYKNRESGLMPIWKYPTVGNNSETRKPIDGGCVLRVLRSFWSEIKQTPATKWCLHMNKKPWSWQKKSRSRRVKKTLSE